MVIFANFCHIWPLATGLFFQLKQHFTPQKTTLIMKAHDFVNKNMVSSKKLNKVTFLF